MRKLVALGLLGLFGLLCASPSPVTAGGGKESGAMLLEALGASRHTLADGIRQGAAGSEAAISAKFEMDREGALSLSVYTVAAGLGTPAEHNLLKELSGSPAGQTWAPKVEIFEDVPHVCRASEQLTLMAISSFSLVEILAKAGKQQAGTAYSITPLLRDRKALFVVLFANEGKSAEVVIDLLTGEPVPRAGE